MAAGREMYVGMEAWTNNNLDTKTKCRHLKKLTCKGLCGRCLSEFMVWRYNQLCWLFSTELRELLPLSPSLWFNSPPFPPPFPVLLKWHFVCVTGGKGGFSLWRNDTACSHTGFTVQHTISWNFKKLAAEQLQSGQAAQTIHHSTNQACRATLLQLSWARRHVGPALLS